jgi:hypothetical protein
MAHATGFRFSPGLTRPIDAASAAAAAAAAAASAASAASAAAAAAACLPKQEIKKLQDAMTATDNVIGALTKEKEDMEVQWNSLRARTGHLGTENTNLKVLCPHTAASLWYLTHRSRAVVCTPRTLPPERSQDASSAGKSVEGASAVQATRFSVHGPAAARTVSHTVNWRLTGQHHGESYGRCATVVDVNCTTNSPLLANKTWLVCARHSHNSSCRRMSRCMRTLVEQASLSEMLAKYKAREDRNRATEKKLAAQGVTLAPDLIRQLEQRTQPVERVLETENDAVVFADELDNEACFWRPWTVRGVGGGQ